MNTYSLQAMYAENFPYLKKLMWILEQILLDHEPSLYEHFKQQGVSVSMFVPRWFLTIFSTSIPISMAIQLWDFFFLDQWLVCIKLAFGILRYFKAELLMLPFEQILTFFSKFDTHFLALLPAGTSMLATNALLNKLFALAKVVSRKKIESLGKKYQLEHNTFLTGK
mmetsp:Transcript_2769/g.3678  ORF Transcript_2769/g.3678 Transcript_2769/m.3678 type:complete len:167 (-) Transcript_2769:1657-2157(-)